MVRVLCGRALVEDERSSSAFIVAGGEITKAARNWLGQGHASQRSQIMFIDRTGILNLYVVANLPLPAAVLPPGPDSGDTDPTKRRSRPRVAMTSSPRPTLSPQRLVRYA